MYSMTNTARRAGRAIALVSTSLILSIGHAAAPQAQAITMADDPWHSIAVADTDHDHAHLITEPSPFDGMDDVQLAAVPKGNRIHYNAPSKCVPGSLKHVLQKVAAKYGPITVNSTYRAPKHNRKVGGKKGSYHLKCAAIDFRVHASTSGLISYLRGQKSVGGYKRYRSGFYHIDIGPRRTW